MMYSLYILMGAIYLAIGYLLAMEISPGKGEFLARLFLLIFWFPVVLIYLIFRALKNFIVGEEDE